MSFSIPSAHYTDKADGIKGAADNPEDYQRHPDKKA
jgi:hypothetical protein